MGKTKTNEGKRRDAKLGKRRNRSTAVARPRKAPEISSEDKLCKIQKQLENWGNQLRDLMEKEVDLESDDSAYIQATSLRAVNPYISSFEDLANGADDPELRKHFGKVRPLTQDWEENDGIDNDPAETDAALKEKLTLNKSNFEELRKRLFDRFRQEQLNDSDSKDSDESVSSEEDEDMDETD